MPTPDLSAIARWPNVPACYGWLSLDRRGRWRLKGEPVTHAGLIAFINRQYGTDGRGNWFLQNGPQRVFADLDYTPWVFHLDESGAPIAHTGESAGDVNGAWIDEEGSVLLEATLGIGVLDDRDLGRFVAECRCADGSAADEEDLLEARGGGPPVSWRKARVAGIERGQVAGRFGFVTRPVSP